MQADHLLSFGSSTSSHAMYFTYIETKIEREEKNAYHKKWYMMMVEAQILYEAKESSWMRMLRRTSPHRKREVDDEEKERQKAPIQN